MSRLRQKLFESYDTHYLRVNSMDEASLSVESYRQRMPDYEASYGEIASGLPQNCDVVDLGCGLGFLLFWLHQSRPGRFQLTGVDVSEAQLALGRKYLPGTITLVREEATTFLERNARSFRAIFCTDVLEHLESDDELLRFLELVKGSLSPGGFLVCQVPNMANLVAPRSRYIDLTHTRGFTSTSLLQLLESVGFCECRIMKRKPADTTQWMRMSLESLIHRMIYRVCGAGDERHFHRNLIGVART
jgi:2-polyprenyl-3-methyl-5-hydroxy-6-metoxy-1,4-benzoquinol methylase